MEQKTTTKRKTLAQKRKEDGLFYKKAADLALAEAQNPNNSEEQRTAAKETYRRCMRALEISKLDLIAAYRVFIDIKE